MKTSESKYRAIVKYKDKFEEIRFTVPKGKKQAVKDYAAARGVSVNALMNDILEYAMNNDLS